MKWTAAGNSYSIKTIEHIRELYECTPYFILGRDAFNEISSWYQADKGFSTLHTLLSCHVRVHLVCPLSEGAW